MKNNLSKNTTLHPHDPHNETADLQCMAKATNKGLCPFVKPFTKNAVKNSTMTRANSKKYLGRKLTKQLFAHQHTHPRVCEIAKPGLPNSKAILDFTSDEFHDMVAGTTNRKCGSMIFSTNPKQKNWDLSGNKNNNNYWGLPRKIFDVQQKCKEACCYALYYGNLDKGGTKKGYNALPEKQRKAMFQKHGCWGSYQECELNRKPRKVVDYCVGNIVKSTKPLPFIGRPGIIGSWWGPKKYKKYEPNWKEKNDATCNGTVVREIHVDGLRPNKEKADSSKILFSTSGSVVSEAYVTKKSVNREKNKNTRNLFLCSSMRKNGMLPFFLKGLAYQDEDAIDSI
jgi:hypothetical protein